MTTDRLHLQPKHRRILEELLQEHLPEVEAWAYGSRITGRSHDGSDLDLVLRGPELKKIPIENLTDFEEALRESPIPFLVEARDWARLPERFHREIERDYVVFMTREECDRRTKQVETAYGRFPVEFSESRLSDLCDDKGIQTGPFGSQLHQKDYVPVGTPILTVEHTGENRILHENLPCVTDYDKERLSKYVLRKGDIVFSRVGSVDRRALVREEEDGWLFSGRCLRVRPDAHKLEPAYLSYFFGLPTFKDYIRSVAVGATMPSLNTQILSDVLIYYPPLPEQRAIAQILGTLDDKIELNRRMNATLEEMARSLFKSWFVDFDPVRAKMEGRDTGLPNDITDLFPDRMVASELGEIPEGWEACTIREIASLNPESWKSGHHPASVAYIDLTNTKWGCLENIETFVWEKAPSRARRVLRKSDTIIATVRPGNGSFALIDEEGLTGSTGFAVLRPHKTYDREFVWCSATSSDNIDRLVHLADGGAYPAIRPSVVLETPVVLADHATRKVFSSTTAKLFDRMETNKRESRTLAALRDVQLPKLISGGLQV